MNTEYILQASKRENTGSSNSKKIRRENGIPAVVYGDKDNNNIILDANEVPLVSAKVLHYNLIFESE